MSAGHWRAAHAVVASLLFLAPHAALATALFEQTNTTGEILAGQSSSDSSSTTIVSQGNVAFPGPTTTTMRVGFNVNADAAPGLVAIEIGVAEFDLRFDLAHAASFDLSFDFLLRGQLLRVQDQECLGSVSLADIEIPTLKRLSDGAEFPLDVVLPGASLDLDGGTTSFNFAQQDSRKVEFRGDAVDSNTYQLKFQVSATAQSLSCEVSARFGADNGSTTGCDACVYPGFGDRVRDDDGLFVTVTAVSLCGNGAPDLGEQCDLGAANGTPGSSCDAFCRSQQTFTVTNADDGGEGSLRIAMGAANLSPGVDTIVFDPEFFSRPRTITLNGALPTIGEELIINGPGANLLTVSGNNQDRVFDVASGVPARLRGLTITGGRVFGSGAGILSAGPLTLTNVAVIGNHGVNSTGGGVALFADGIFTNCTFSGNTTDVQGGGIGFRSDGGHTLRLFSSTVSGNSSSSFGGGIYHLSLDGSGTLDIVDSTIADNAAPTGGGVMTAAGANGSPVTTLRNTIVANNDSSDLVGAADPGGTATVTSLGFNLASDDGGGFLNGTDDQINTDPILGPLQYNGGQTPTHMLLAGSPALDNGESLSDDQRGVARPFEIPGVGSAGRGNAADIGAVEAHALIVSNADDSGAGSLRQVIAEAPANSDILFDPSIFNVARTIELTSGEILIDKDQTINGPGADLLAISGRDASRIFRVASGGLDVAISGVTIRNGKAADVGGGIVSDSNVTLSRCIIRDNAAGGGGGGGGGVFVAASLATFTDCTIIDNTAPGPGGAVALLNNAAGIFRGCTLKGNESTTRGGAVDIEQSTATFTNCTFSGNQAPAQGGAIDLVENATGSFTGCTLNGNQSGVRGGAVNVNESDATFTNCTISGNMAPFGGGIALFNSNVNSALAVTNSTITANIGTDAAGIRVQALAGVTASATLRNSIVARNIGPNLSTLATVGSTATITSLGYNLTDDDATFFDQPTDLIDNDPLLGPLQNNGGATPTHMPLAGSPALDKGNSSSVALDQRGRPRRFDLAGIEPAAGGDNSDIGAVEAQAQIVTNADDSGSGSLRQVIADAPPDSDILFDDTIFNVVRTIELTSGEILIDKDQTINGPGADLLAISGLDASRVFRVAAGGLHVAMSGLTITNGNAADRGGGIASDSDLTLSRCAIVGNTAGSDSPGGGVHVRGSLATFTDCAFERNRAPGAGGAVFLINATGRFSGCTLSGNESGQHGGAVAAAGSSAEFSNCTISGNMAPVLGGGIALFTANSNQTLAVTNSTVTANSGTEAGGIRVEAFGRSATATLRNSIVARNIGPNLQTVATTGASATIVSLGYNLTDDDNTFLNQPTDLIDTDPMIGPLQNNGGFTETHALLADSPAIDKGSSSGTFTDQRGNPRPVDDPALPNAEGGDGADIGAFELELPVIVATATPTVTPTSTEGPSPTPTRTFTDGLSPTPTRTFTDGPSPTPTRTFTDGPSPTPTPTGTATPTRTPTSTAPPGLCRGDCNGNRAVEVDELVRGVIISLGRQAAAVCMAFDANANGSVSIDELLAGIGNALDGCPL